MNKENKEQPENIEDAKDLGKVKGEISPQENSDQLQPATPKKSFQRNNDGKKISEKKSEGEGVKVSEKATAAAGSKGQEIIEKVISINRITKVTKGGKKLSFSALVVVGDTMGNVGYSLEKAAEVAIAIKKAMITAKKNMVKIPMRGTTIPHEIIGQCGGSRVLLKPASDGTGVIASGPVRAVCDGAGIHNILTKCHRSNNPINVVKATINGLMRLKTTGLSDTK